MAKKSALGDNFDSIFDDGLFGSEESSVPMKLKISDIEPIKEYEKNSGTSVIVFVAVRMRTAGTADGGCCRNNGKSGRRD